MRPRALLYRLRSWLHRREMSVWYDPRYRLPLSGLEAGAGVEPRRADFVRWWLRACGAVPKGGFHAPRRISYEDLARVHDADLLESLVHADTLARVFAVDPSDVPVDEVMTTIRLACGGTLAAARETLRTRAPALNLLGGFHHAAPGAAGGFCPVNDIAVAVAVLRAEGLGGRVVVLDLDAHPPDGTDACLAEDPDRWIGSLSGSDWGPLPRVDETVLPTGAGDAAYLEALGALLARMPRPALAFVIAGGDVLAGDRFGRLGLSLDGARERDLRVAAELEGVPAVWVPGGGYSSKAWRVLAGTGMALAAGSLEPIPDEYDPLSARFAVVSRQLSRATSATPARSPPRTSRRRSACAPGASASCSASTPPPAWSTRSSATACSSSSSAWASVSSGSPSTRPAWASGSGSTGRRRGSSTCWWSWWSSAGG